MSRITRIFLVFLSFWYLAAEAAAIRPAGTPPPMSKQLAAQRKLSRHRETALFGVLRERLTPAEREALTFLLAYLPLSDLADCTGAYLLEHVRTTLAARREMPWGSRIPDAIFRHFVLPHRVNNENLDRFRTVMYPELSGRVRHLSMEQAVLEINHWCHEHVNYRSTDGRTSSPLAVCRTGFGRCGEESTFTVSALRAAGLPARQCYTPRWAHTDDNHAWVEVWVDGRWHYLGACEPAPALDQAWFTEPARRAMLVHTRCMGVYEEEPVIRHTPWVTELNLTARYAPVQPVTVQVLDGKGKPVPGAQVEYQLYNYAEFYPLVALETGPQGLSSINLGLGSLLIRASRGEQSGFAFYDPGRSGPVEVKLAGLPASGTVVERDLVPPVEPPPLPLDEAGRAANEIRLKAEDDMRAAYQAAFMNEAQACQLAAELELPPAEVWSLISRSAGNWRELAEFFRQAPAGCRPWLLPFLHTLAEKDLRDAPASILLAHLAAALPDGHPPPGLDRAIFIEGLLAPRIDLEGLIPYRQSLCQSFPASAIRRMRDDPRRVFQWIRSEIRLDTLANYSRTPLTPRGVMELRVADPLSRDIFAVALCRSLGIPSRLEPATREPQYYRNGTWFNAGFQRTGPDRRQTGWLVREAAGESTAMRYATHFTIEQYRQGRYHTLSYPDDRPLADFPARLELEAGHYLVVTGTRGAGQSVRARLVFLDLPPGKELPVQLLLRQQAIPLPPLGRLDRQLTLYHPETGAGMTLLDLSGRRGTILAWLAPLEEPSQHVLNNFRQLHDKFSAWDGGLLLIGPPLPAGLPALPAQTRWLNDPDGKLLNAVRRELNKQPGRLPVLILLDHEGRIIHFSEGYSTGTGELLLRIIQSMSPEEEP